MIKQDVLIPVFLLFTIIIYSQESVSSRFRNCVNENIPKNTSRNIKYNFFELMQRTEGLLIKHNILRASNKSCYYNFLNKEKINKRYHKLESALTKIYKEKRFDVNFIGTNMVVFGQCHKKFKNEDLEVPFYQIGKNINTIWINGFYEAKSLKKLFEIIPEKNFKEIYIRAPIIYMTVIRILEDY